jgi:hypothetical protein
MPGQPSDGDGKAFASSGHASVSAPPEPAPAPLPPVWHRRPLQLLGAAILGLAVGVTTVVATSGGARSYREPRMPPAVGFAPTSKQEPHTGPWLATATVISSIGYSDDAPGTRYSRAWGIGKVCWPAPRGCQFTLTRQIAGEPAVSAPLVWHPDGWHATFPLRSYSCRYVGGKWVDWQQQDSMVLVFADGGRTTTVHERRFSEAPACGYGTDTVGWTARLDWSLLPPDLRPVSTPTAVPSGPPTTPPPAVLPLKSANADPSLSPDARRAAPLAAANSVPPIEYQNHVCTRAATVTPASPDVRAAWRRFAALLDQAGCSPALDTVGRRRALLGMMSAQACYQVGPVRTTAAQDSYYCRQTLDQLIQMAADEPIAEQLKNLLFVDGRAYADAIGNVRLVPHGKSWWITQI